MRRSARHGPVGSRHGLDDLRDHAVAGRVLGRAVQEGRVERRSHDAAIAGLLGQALGDGALVYAHPISTISTC